MLKELVLLCQYKLHMKPTTSRYSVIQQCHMHYLFFFNVFYCNLKEKDHIRRIISSTKSKYLYEKSVLLFFWFTKNFESVGPIQKIKLPSPNDHISTFDQLIAMDKSFCIHHQNINRLLTEIYKALHNISGNSLKELFVRRESTISLWSKPELVIPSVNFVFKGKNSLICFGSITWNSLPTEIREDNLILSFVLKIKQWKPITCPCTICKSYINTIGHIKFSDY